MAWEEDSCICLNMQLIAILSRIGVIYHIFKSNFLELYLAYHTKAPGNHFHLAKQGLSDNPPKHQEQNPLSSVTNSHPDARAKAFPHQDGCTCSSIFSVYHYASLDFLCAAHNGFCF